MGSKQEVIIFFKGGRNSIDLQRKHDFDLGNSVFTDI